MESTVKATIQAQNTQGKSEKITVETAFPKLKTVTKGGGYYVLEDLMKFAETGKLTEGMKANSPALVTMKQEEAVSILTDALAADSIYVKEVVAADEKSSKKKSEKAEEEA